MRLRIDRVTVAGDGLDARRLADRLVQDLPAALARALAPGPQPATRDHVDRVARTIARKVQAALARHQMQEEGP